MASIFTRIISGDVPARFVWKDDLCVAFLSINPLRPGHTLVVPRREIDHWLDVDLDLMNHLTSAAQIIGKALQAAFHPEKVGLLIAVNKCATFIFISSRFGISTTSTSATRPRTLIRRRSMRQQSGYFRPWAISADGGIGYHGI